MWVPTVPDSMLTVQPTFFCNVCSMHRKTCDTSHCSWRSLEQAMCLLFPSCNPWGVSANRSTCKIAKALTHAPCHNWFLVLSHSRVWPLIKQEVSHLLCSSLHACFRLQYLQIPLPAIRLNCRDRKQQWLLCCKVVTTNLLHSHCVRGPADQSLHAADEIGESTLKPTAMGLSPTMQHSCVQLFATIACSN